MPVLVCAFAVVILFVFTHCSVVEHLMCMCALPAVVLVLRQVMTPLLINLMSLMAEDVFTQHTIAYEMGLATNE